MKRNNLKMLIQLVIVLIALGYFGFISITALMIKQTFVVQLLDLLMIIICLLGMTIAIKDFNEQIKNIH